MVGEDIVAGLSGGLGGVVGSIVFQFAIALFGFAGIFIFLFFYSGWDRYQKKVPLFMRANEKVDIFTADADDYRINDIYSTTYGAVVWARKEGGWWMYIPKIKSPVIPLPPNALKQTVMKFVKVGQTYIPIVDMRFNPRFVEGTDEPHHYVMEVVIPEISSMIEDTRLALGYEAELLRPKENPLEKVMHYGVIALIVILILFVGWFSFSQMERALGVAPEVVRQAMQGCQNIIANQTRYM